MKYKTNILGIFGSGILGKAARRCDTASDGAIAAVMASNYIENLG